MREIGNIIVITQKEYDELDQKAKIIIKERDNTKTLNMRLRFPYYIPGADEVEEHSYIPMSDILPYYLYLMTRDENGAYMLEPDDEILNETRTYMRQVYQSRIILVEDKAAEEEFVSKFKKE